MGLSIRIIPVLLKRGNALVKGQKFDSWRSVGHPLQAARIHAARGVDELMILEIGSPPDIKTILSLTNAAFMPITIGGGITKLSCIKDVLRSGADKVCIKSKSLISEASKIMGKQAICASLEDRGQDIVREAQELEEIGAGEILLQSVDRDGMMGGYDLDLIQKTTRAVNIPVIASCGCGTYEHMLDAIQCGASAVASGAMFQFTEKTPLGAARYLSEHGIEVRI